MRTVAKELAQSYKGRAWSLVCIEKFLLLIHICFNSLLFLYTTNGGIIVFVAF